MIASSLVYDASKNVGASDRHSDSVSANDYLRFCSTSALRRVGDIVLVIAASTLPGGHERSQILLYI